MSSKAKQVKEASEEEIKGTLMVEQTYMAARVVQTLAGEYDIEFAIAGGPSISVVEADELVAQSIFQGLDVMYKTKLKELQEDVLVMLEELTEAAREGESSDSTKGTEE